ncbi:MAG: hypothetical protein LUF35_06840 [Lachnospiraceae bacterium]|nr:hypothetical protein [Lachnospiraceae bacterium]
MYKRRIASIDSRTKIYHYPGCHYAKRILPKYQLEKSKHDMEKDGFRPCRYCNTMKFRFEQERPNLQRYAQYRKMEFNMVDGQVFIKTEIGCWKLIYSKHRQSFILYHRNASGRPVNFEHPERERYHKQMDQLYSDTITSVFIYIYKHDQFRVAEKAADGNLDIRQVSKKYQPSAARRQRRQKIRRLDNLFRVIESGSEEYRRLSYC